MTSRARKPRRRWWAACGLAFVVLAPAYLVFTGPQRLDHYPSRETSLYRLPWPAGGARWCVQSNRGIVSHRGEEEFAYDFYMPVGSAVCAARDGIVTRVEQEHEGQGFSVPNNLIAIEHADTTRAWYLHMEKGGSLVRVGERVRRGQKIARSGNVGRSTGPHLHFQVTEALLRTVPVSFGDVTKHAGVPRMLFRYTSGNSAP